MVEKNIKLYREWCRGKNVRYGWVLLVALIGLVLLSSLFYQDNPSTFQNPSTHEAKDVFVRDEDSFLFQVSADVQVSLSIGTTTPNNENKDPIVIDPKLASWEIESITYLHFNSSLSGNVFNKGIPQLLRSSSSIRGGNCTPPQGREEVVINTCCVGATSLGGRILFNNTDMQCALGFDAYDRVRLAAMEVMNHGSLQLIPSSYSSSTKATVNRCDVCRIFEIAQQNNYSIAFNGDSVHWQGWHGFLCELARNEHDVHLFSHQEMKKAHWHFGVSFIDTVQISKSNNNGKTETIWARFYHQYRPLENNMTQMREIAEWADILFFHFGVHWTRAVNDTYFRDITNVLSELSNHKFALLAHRETSSQHFSAAGGEYGIQSKHCVPLLHNDAVHGWRERLMRQVALDAGFQVETADSSLFGRRDDNDVFLGKQRNDESNPQKLFIIPFLNFTRGLHYMHKQKFTDMKSDCTHFCSVPFLWMPLWRSLRLALEYQEELKKGTTIE